MAAAVAPAAGSSAASSISSLASGALAVGASVLGQASPHVEKVVGKLSEVSASVKEETLNRAVEKLKAEFGQEVVDMFAALKECTNTLSAELGLSSAKYGLMMALPLVHLHDFSHEPPESKGECNDAMLMSWARYWLEYAAGAYGVGEPSEPAEKLVTNGISAKGWAQPEVLYAYLPDKELLPGHYVAVDTKMRAVILGVRGTSTPSDAIVDAVGHSVDLPEVQGLQVHKAMLDGARKVLEKTRPKLDEALSNNPGFQLIVTGHSLGAGTATLCSVLLKTTPLTSKPKLTCFAYAPPPVLSTVTGAGIDSILRSIKMYAFVNRNDAVPRASLHNVYQLGKKCMKVDGLDLGVMERVALIRRGGTADADPSKKDEVVKAAKDAQEETKKEHGKFPPLFIGGRIFWINGPNPSDGTDGEWPAPGTAGSIKLLETSASEFQSLLLKGGKTMGSDHLCGKYGDGLDACGCKVDVEALAAQAKKDTNAKAPKCCVMQ